ncbi:uncharacterized protein LOC119279440 [Triticum dicoccoides]|uniref:uncharacterized protein LOC119279440 n=1 Tax=Triticum dicoccoides TaxID=85692 RepID=UPI00188ECEBC|nr:uncharacterized protein LOC119279440 [Triticum dicoccoides]
MAALLVDSASNIPYFSLFLLSLSRKFPNRRRTSPRFISPSPQILPHPPPCSPTGQQTCETVCGSNLSLLLLGLYLIPIGDGAARACLLALGAGSSGRRRASSTGAAGDAHMAGWLLFLQESAARWKLHHENLAGSCCGIQERNVQLPDNSSELKQLNQDGSHGARRTQGQGSRLQIFPLA